MVNTNALQRRKPHNQTSRVVARLRRHILKKCLKPGNVVGTESQLATDLRVSHRVVRDAVQQLRANGLLHTKPGVGLIMGHADPVRAFGAFLPMFAMQQNTLSELRRFRYIIEIGAVGLASVNVSNKQLRELAVLVEDWEKYQLAGIENPQPGEDSDDLDVIDIRFHGLILEASSSQMAMKLHGLIDRIFREEGQQMQPRARFEHLRATYAEHRNDHRRILEALSAHDPAEAEKQIRHHLLLSVEDPGREELGPLNGELSQ